ncbi:MAG: hypothetical protein Q7K71_00710 [Candidatus Omnitrophota bacterium]|nr:hypothetical protein [Candidatus Omnitrophota bacterium]
MIENFLPRAFFISLTAHTLLVCGGYFLKHPDPHKDGVRPKGVEIVYRPAPRPLVPDLKQRPIKPSQVIPVQGTVPVKLAKPDQGLPKNFTVDERRPRIIRSMQASYHVSMTHIKSEKINNPAYASYNELVRRRIEEKVYANFSKMESGTVYLTFVLASDGTLKAAQIIEAKSRATGNLQDISMKSLKQAQFPQFLKGMTLPEYTFNIEIQYQLNDDE